MIQLYQLTSILIQITDYRYIKKQKTKVYKWSRVKKLGICTL